MIVRSVSTRIVFSPRIIAERSALKSRKVKPVPSMLVVVPFVEPHVAADDLRLARVVLLRRDVEVHERPSCGSTGLTMSWPVRLFSYIFG